MSKPDTVVGAIAVVIATRNGRMCLSTDLMANLKVTGETPQELNVKTDIESLRAEIVGHLNALATIISNPESDLSQLFEMEMRE